MKLALTETPKTGFLATRPICSQLSLDGLDVFQCLDIPEVVELLKITDSCACHPLEKQAPENSLKHPFVVVEGMDATGMSMIQVHQIF